MLYRPLLAITLSCLAAGLAGCAAPAPTTTDALALGSTGQSGRDTEPPWAAPPIEHAVVVLDGHTGERVPFAAMLDALAAADVVFLGETHVDETTHRVELAVYEGLLDRRGGNVVLAMEMFERDVQPVLDAYVAGAIDETEFLARSRPWAQYRSAYRPLIERARADRRPVVASNFPRPLVRRVAMEGLGVLDTLEADERSQAPAEILPNTPAYWKRVDNAIRGHLGMMGGGGDDQRLTSTQTLWDNAMGESCALALEAHPGASVLHVNGAFHSMYWDGTVRQLRLRKPDARILTVDITPSRSPISERHSGAPVADYVVVAERRATDLYQGRWTVALDGVLKYRLHVPEDATGAPPVPLLVWLGDAGLTAQDGIDLWKDRLGDEAMIAVIEPAYRALMPDRSEGGRWTWPDSFLEDIGAIVDATEEIGAYLARHFSVDPARVVVAGEGTGATVVAALALLGERMDHEALAYGPSRYAKLKDFPLPLPEERGDEPPRDVTLRVVGTPEDEPWWQDELAAYEGVGLPGSFAIAPVDPIVADHEQERALRAALGIAPPATTHDAALAYLAVDADSPRARHWARLHALKHRAATGQPVAIVRPDEAPPPGAAALDLPMHPLAIEDAIPLCPGPFGGTTVIVLPPDMPEADVRAWIALEENDPLARRGRFHRARVATADPADAERHLPAMLASLEAAGRRNVLIVPAVFCADAEMMRSLERSTGDVADRMTLQWMPGLGGDLPVAGEAAQAAVGVVEHDLRVELDPERNHLSVTDAIALPPTVRRAGAEFSLNASLAITSASPAVQRVGTDESGVARYALDAAPADGMLRLAYAGTIEHGLSDEKEEYSRGFRDTQGIVGPEGVYLDGGSAWVPRFRDEMIRFNVEVRGPESWHVISQGNGASDVEPGLARWESGAELEQIYLVGGPLLVERESAGAVEALVYLHERDEALARKYLDATARYLEMYRSLIGPYPYEKFALVENFWETGYGMPSFTLLGPQVIRLPFILHSSYPHEILHNWWGNSVFVDYESGNWCEGLTAYMADHLVQEQRGAGAAYRRGTLQKYLSYVKEGRDFPLAEFRSRHSAATEAVGYGKSLMLFHMLRREIGDDAFRRVLADFYRQNRGQRASFGDIRASVDRVTGEDFGPFFAQWVERTGAPSLRVRDGAARPAGDGSGSFVVTGTIEQMHAGAPYAMTVPVAIATAAGTHHLDVELAERAQPFELVVDARPGTLSVDPAFDVFRLLDPYETPASIGQIYGQPDIVAVLPSASPAVDRYRSLVEGWRTDDHAIEIVLDTELETLPGDRAAWILGRENRFANAFLSFDPDAAVGEPGGAITLADERVPADDRSIVVIRRHPDDPEKAIGWISVDREAAFPGMQRKLPHYGKYSYLAFEGDEPTNVVKGQWDATDSPMLVELDADVDAVVAVAPSAALAELPPVFSQRTLREHVEWLASSERRGRGLGTPELDDCARYIADRFSGIGLDPGGDAGEWFQEFTVAEGPDGRPVKGRNVIGILPGKRADWSEQSVVIGAHYDHLGLGWPDVRAGAEGQIHHGADDNASGVAVLIELAHTIAAEGGGSRNLVFVAFSAEEAGLGGSRHYVKQPALSAGGIRGMINMDTVGRLSEGGLAVHATGTADEWQHIFRGVGFVTGITGKNVPARVGGSDQDAFIDAGIPAVQIFTGAHVDYHRPTDTADRVDYAGLVNVATFVKEAVAYLIEREEPLTVKIDGAEAAPAPAVGGPGGRRVSFGTVPSFEFPGPGVQVDDVVPGSPAEQAGIRAGDVLVRIDGADMTDLRAFSEHLKTLRPGQEVEATVVRDGAEMTVRVKVVAR